MGDLMSNLKNHISLMKIFYTQAYKDIVYFSFLFCLKLVINKNFSVLIVCSESNKHYSVQEQQIVMIADVLLESNLILKLILFNALKD